MKVEMSDLIVEEERELTIACYVLGDNQSQRSTGKKLVENSVATVG